MKRDKRTSQTDKKKMKDVYRTYVAQIAEKKNQRIILRHHKERPAVSHKVTKEIIFIFIGLFLCTPYGQF